MASILKKHLKGKKLSEVSKATGITPQRLHDWVMAEKIPSLKSIDQLNSLAKYLGLELSELLLGDSPRDVISSAQFKHAGNTFSVTIERLK